MFIYCRVYTVRTCIHACELKNNIVYIYYYIHCVYFVFLKNEILRLKSVTTASSPHEQSGK